MACEFICDGCGKRESGHKNGGTHRKPSGWHNCGEFLNGGAYIACSIPCRDKTVAKYGRDAAGLPRSRVPDDMARLEQIAGWKERMRQGWCPLDLHLAPCDLADILRRLLIDLERRQDYEQEQNERAGP